VKEAFVRANRLLKKTGLPPLGVGNRKEADSFAQRYISANSITPICTVSFESRPIALYASSKSPLWKVFVIPFLPANLLYIQADHYTEAGFALAWGALFNYFLWRKDIFSVISKFYTDPHSPTRIYTLIVTPTPDSGRFEVNAFYNLRNDSFQLAFRMVSSPSEELISKGIVRNDFSAIRDYLLHPIALLSI
jgi:hypothetical protein